jgi:glycosyltransferase involved in cell wall biosynthesis
MVVETHESAPLRLRALLPMACDGVGPSATCLNLLRGMTAGGADCTLHVNRLRVGGAGVAHHAAVPGWLARLPYRLVREVATRRSEAGFLAGLRPDEVAYLWPEASLKVHEIVAGRGNPILLEGINTRMASAKAILDAEYDRLGLAPAHGITEARIAEEEEKLALATAIFAPSRGVEAALAGAPLPPERVLASSYGVALGPPAPERVGPPDRPLRVLFVGTACVRKGVHHLLDAWAAGGGFGELVLAGAIEPAIRAIRAAELARPDVTALGFVRDVAALYREADVFVLTSLEEGDPLVTYEAAAQGLPLVVSPMGAGRIAEAGAGALMVDPHEPEAIVAALRALGDPEWRRALGRDARRAAEDYDWIAVGRRRAGQLAAFLAAGG